MLTGPKGQKRPADVIGNAVDVMKLATAEIEEGAPLKAIFIGEIRAAREIPCSEN